MSAAFLREKLGMFGRNKPAGAPHPERAVDVALAEYNALRAEITAHLTTQAAVVGLGFTALGVVFGFVIKEGASDELLLLIPPIALVAVLLHTAETYRIILVGAYIRDDLWPFLQREVGPVKSWETVITTHRRKAGTFVTSLFFDGPAYAVFILASIVALAVVNHPPRYLFAGGIALTFVSVAVPIAVGLAVRSDGE